MAVAIAELETLKLTDGTSVTISKLPGMLADEWKEYRKHLEENPAEAHQMEMFSNDAKKVKSYLQQQAITEYYESKMASGDEAVTSKLLGMDKAPEFYKVFEEVKKSGMEAAEKHASDDQLLMKVNRFVGGVPEEVKDALTKIATSPVTLQEACKMGDLKAVEACLATSSSAVEATDSKGITGLGYAIGANRIAIVKLLLEKKADASKCDLSGGNGVHYAAAYGRKELLDLLIKGGVSVNAKNTQGQTPLALATKNKQKEAIELLNFGMEPTTCVI